MALTNAVMTLEEIETQIGFQLPLESCAEPILRYTSVDCDGGALVPWLVSRHDAAGASGAAAAADSAAAPCEEGRTNLASQLSCANFERFECEVEWTKAVDEEVRGSANQLRTAVGSLPQPAPTNLNDAMVHCRLLNFALSLPVQSIHAERQQALAKEKEKEAQAQAQAAFPFMSMPLSMPMSINSQPFMPFFPPSPFVMPGHMPPPTGRTPATAGSSQLPAFFGTPAPFSFSPGANHLASVLLNLDPNGTGSGTGSGAAAASTAPAMSSATTSSVATRPLLGASQSSRGVDSKRVPLSPMGALHSLANISTAPHGSPAGALPPPSPSSSLASQALLGIGAPSAASSSSPHRKRPAPSGLMQPPAQKATGDRRARTDNALHAQTLATLQAARPAAAAAAPAKPTLSPPKPHRLSQRKSTSSAGTTTPTAHSASKDTAAGSFLPLTVLADQAV